MKNTRNFTRLLFSVAILGGVFFISTTKFVQRLTQPTYRFHDYIKSKKTQLHVQYLMHNQDYKPLIKLLKAQLDKTISLDEIITYGQSYQLQPVVAAAHATKAIITTAQLPHLRTRDIFEAAFFIESSLQNQIAQNKHFFPKIETELAFDIEFDPKTQSRFIHLAGLRGAKLGEGHFKVVSRSILYDRINPLLVARAVQNHVQRRELILTNSLMGSKGIVETIALTTFKDAAKEYHSIFTKLYHPGCLHSVLKGPIKFTLKEKMKMALNILEGIHSLHKANIAHRDLGARNYLVNIETDTTGQRDVTAVVSDLGRAIPIESAAHTKPQGNSAYLSPEALFRDQMAGPDYLPADIYAAGCVLYQLFYETLAPWQVFGRTNAKDAETTYQELVRNINASCQNRIEELTNKRQNNSASPQEEFELLILRMCSPNPKDRGTAQELRDEMQVIYTGSI